MISDPVLLTKCLERSAVKLCSVVRHQYLWDVKMGYDVLPYKLFGISVCDVGQRFCLYPLGEIVRGHNKPLTVSRSSGERSHYIQTPLGEWPWACNRVETGRRLVDRWSEPLTFITFLYVLGSVFLHVRPPIALLYGTMCQRLSPCMASTYSFVNLP
jgi:hypothetical protein